MYDCSHFLRATIDQLGELLSDNPRKWVFSIVVNSASGLLNNFQMLFFLFSEITSEAVLDCMERFSTSSNNRLSNLAKVFLQVKNGFSKN